jgi:PD-(D/E)XK endonuclease
MHITKRGAVDAVYCSYRCKVAEQRGKALSHGTAGALAELVVAIDLLQRGYDVFRSVSPSCSCDLVAQKDGVLTTIEVRTGLKFEKGGMSSGGGANSIRAECLALVLKNRRNEVHYSPDMP